jgi:hypothetical protein
MFGNLFSNSWQNRENMIDFDMNLLDFRNSVRDRFCFLGRLEKDNRKEDWQTELLVNDLSSSGELERSMG